MPLSFEHVFDYDGVMTRAEDLAALEASVPWADCGWRADLAALRETTAAAAVAHAAQVRLLARLVARVPRCAGDDRGATPWTSFRQEVAVARQVSARAAAALVREAVALTTTMPTTLALLERGAITVERATTFVRELEPYDDAVVSRLDADLAERVAGLAAWRSAQEVRRAAQLLDPEAGAQRVAVKNASRGVLLTPDADDQASVTITGPAVPLHRWYATIDQRARTLKAAGDPRGLDALRFDLTTSTLPCAVHPPTDQSLSPDQAHQADHPTSATRGSAGAGAGVGEGGLRPSFVEAAAGDCRMSRPVQAHVVVPVETALGLSNEPAWLDGHGWISAPTTRLLLVDAELKRVCAQTGTGELVDVATRWHRPPPTPAGVRAGLLELVVDDAVLSGAGDRDEPQHDPTEGLREFVELRDRSCDGPTGQQTPARSCDLDHHEPYPHGPTAAWNLTARARRTHGLKHYGWIPVRTPTATVWTSPSGQLVLVPRHVSPPPGIDAGRDDKDQPALPDPTELDLLDRGQLDEPSDDGPPWLPASEQAQPVPWTWLDDNPTDLAS